MSAGTVVREVAKELDTLRIVRDPLEATEFFEADSSHAEIIGLPTGDSEQAMLVGDLIAECIIDMHPAIIGPVS